MSGPHDAHPLVYSCSGRSGIAQIANRVALALDGLGKAEMSCIAGVGGDVPSLVAKAKSGRPILALDGCPLRCVKSCLARHGVSPAVHLTLTEWGIRKDISQDEAAAEAPLVLGRVLANLPE